MSYQSARLSSCRQFPFTRSARVAATNSGSASPAAQLTSEFTSKQRSAVEIIKHHIGLVREKDSRLGSFLHVDEEGALAQAQALDAKLAAGEHLGPLAGVPVAVKDNICTIGVPTTAASRYLEHYVPPYDATAVARLRAAGAIIIGKTNCDEFGMGSTTENSAYQNTKNAWSMDHVPGQGPPLTSMLQPLSWRATVLVGKKNRRLAPNYSKTDAVLSHAGGSSGGSAAAVASGQVPIALGSDTGGSVRLPAHFNGCVGLKPTYGRVSRYGLLAFASSLDCIGPMARSVEDVATTLEVMSGHDPMDATSLHAPVENVAARFPSASDLPSKPLDGLKVGVIEQCMGSGLSASVKATADATCRHLESLGATVGAAQLPNFSAGLPAYYVIATSEASSNLSRYDGVRYGTRAATDSLKDMYCLSRGQGLGEEVKRRILMGTYALSAGYYDAFYKKAQQVRTIVSRDFDAALKDYDILLAPVSATPAYKFGEKTKDPLSMYLGDLMTVNLNLAGLPAVTLNCGFHQEDGVQLPIGMQFIGKHLSEPQLLGVTHAVELTHAPAQTYPE